jgi:hypothetical protein
VHLLWLPAAAFDSPAFFLQFFDKAVAMVSLDFDNAVFDRSAGAAFLFQSRCKFLESGFIQSNSRNDRHSFSLSAFGFPADTDDAVAFERCCRLPTRALGGGPAAGRAHPAMLRRKDNSAEFIVFQFFTLPVVNLLVDNLEYSTVVVGRRAKRTFSPAVNFS